MSNQDKRRTGKVRDTLKRKPVPSEKEIQEFFYSHHDAVGYALPHEKDNDD